MTLLDQKIDVLLIVPNDLQKAAAAVQLAQREGVKVISYDRLVLESNFLAHLVELAVETPSAER
jgi:ABC-type xylose transport system substrate-binding protein